MPDRVPVSCRTASGSTSSQPGRRRADDRASCCTAGRWTPAPGAASSPGFQAAVGRPVRIITYDARGHGRSGGSAMRGATLAQLGDDLAEVIAAVAPTGPLVLAGHSLGGMTIMEYADGHGRTSSPRGWPAWSSSPRPPRAMPTRRTGSPRGSPAWSGSPRPAGRACSPGSAAQAAAPVRAPRAAPLAALAALRRPLLPPRTWRHHGRRGAGLSCCAIGAFRPSVGEQQRLTTLAALGTCPRRRWSATATGSLPRLRRVDRRGPARRRADRLPRRRSHADAGAPRDRHRRAGGGGGRPVARAALRAPPGRRGPPGRLTRRSSRTTSSRWRRGTRAPNAVAGVCAPGVDRAAAPAAGAGQQVLGRPVHRVGGQVVRVGAGQRRRAHLAGAVAHLAPHLARSSRRGSPRTGRAGRRTDGPAASARTGPNRSSVAAPRSAGCAGRPAWCRR